MIRIEWRVATEAYLKKQRQINLQQCVYNSLKLHVIKHSSSVVCDN